MFACSVVRLSISANPDMPSSKKPISIKLPGGLMRSGHPGIVATAGGAPLHSTMMVDRGSMIPSPFSSSLHSSMSVPPRHSPFKQAHTTGFPLHMPALVVPSTPEASVCMVPPILSTEPEAQISPVVCSRLNVHD